MKTKKTKRHKRRGTTIVTLLGLAVGCIIGAAKKQAPASMDGLGRYTSKSKYIHLRQYNSDEFDKSTLKTVPISHTSYKGKWLLPGVQAVTGKKLGLKKYAWKVQSILVPKSLFYEMTK